MSRRGRRVSASQVGQYAFCACAWWLAAIEKKQPTDLDAIERGERAHERHGWRVSLARGSRRLAFLLFAAAALALLIWGIASLL